MTAVDFSHDYATARNKFIDVATAAGAALDSVYCSDQSGRDGEDLYTDVARFGCSVAKRVLIISSGTHGIEGYCGSAIQINAIRRGLFSELSEDSAVLIVHALNPYGFSHQRRVNEDNVDLNRNFIDFSKPIPKNDAYSALHPFLVPTDWNGPAKKSADESISEYIDQHGEIAFKAAVCAGQYDEDTGIFFGGDRPVWSNDTWRSILQNHISNAVEITHLDIHSGLGPFGYGEIMCLNGLNSREAERLRAKVAQTITFPGGEGSSIYEATGYAGVALIETAPSASITLAVQEFGTVPICDMINAVAADNWLHIYGDPTSEFGLSVKAALRDAFYPDNKGWRDTVLNQGYNLTSQLLR